LCFIGVIGALSVPPSEAKSALYPAWAHHHWVWLSAEQANQVSELTLVKDYLARNIKVGAVDIDSQWATGDNNFIWNAEKYRDPAGMVKEFHDMGVRVILWVTSMVDTDSSNFAEGLEKGYFLNEGETIKWWHGEGAFMDYTNPEALDWWHEQMQKVIDIGIDGWKCDGTDPFVFELIVPYGHKGVLSHREYADSYYRDFFYYTKKTNPEALIMARPVDSFDNILYLEFAPRDVVFSGWTGDADPTFAGMREMLNNMFHSAWAGYVNFGTDIGGYRNGNRTKNLFTRWFQMGAFTPLMENGGDGEHRPWMWDNTNKTLNTYRDFVDMHYQLNTYLLSAGTTAYEQGISVMKPIAIQDIIPYHSWDFMLWKDILVCPIVEDSLIREIIFPKGNDWVDWWNASLVYEGGTTQVFEFPMDRFPVYHRKGSIIPLNVDSKVAYHGDASHENFLTVLIHPVRGNEESFTARYYKETSQDLMYDWTSEDLVIKTSTHAKKVIILLRSVTCPKSIYDVINAATLPKILSKAQLSKSGNGFYCDLSRSQVFVLISKQTNGVWISIDSSIKHF